MNEQIETLNRGLAEISDNKLHIVCECGDLRCAKQLVVQVTEYERIRADPALFFVIPGHEIPDVEDVVEQEPAYRVVRKHEGEPARMARKLNPRDPE
ncbi:MAG TPA: hypothetical protein VFB25_05870 [Gaiellaceae bacterium]|nr:hypothetical protein [Gaiellaceae bacterium]